MATETERPDYWQTLAAAGLGAQAPQLSSAASRATG